MCVEMKIDGSMISLSLVIIVNTKQLKYIQISNAVS